MQAASPHIPISELKEFLIVAITFQETMLEAPKHSRETFARRMLKVAPLLYVKALCLSEKMANINPEDDTLVPQYVTEEEYSWVSRGLEELLGPADYFLETLSEEMQFTDAPITARISEYLSDIYQPLGNIIGVVRDENSRALEPALNRCMLYFAEYWGDKLLAVSRPLHQILFLSDEPVQADEATSVQEPLTSEKMLENQINAFIDSL